MTRSRPSYAVVTGVVTGLAIFGAGLRLAREALPRPASLEALGVGDFIRQGAGQRVRWRALGTEAIAEARRTEKPILLVLGAAWSEDARIADQLIFADEDVAGFVNRNFLPIRADVDRDPALLNAYLPRSRWQLPVGPGFQIAFLTPQGDLYDYYGRRGFVPFDPPLFVPELAAARAAYDDLPFGDRPKPQALEIEALKAPERYGAPDPADLALRLQESQRPDGNFEFAPSASLRPTLYSFLLSANEKEALRKALAPILRSGLVDWLDGGFFRRARTMAWTDVDFDKLAVTNADMMEVLAKAAILLDEPVYRQIAERTFDSLATDLADSRFSATARIGDEDLRGRSRRSSFSFREIQTFWGGGLLSVEDARWAGEHMGLDPRRNNQMAIRVAKLEVTQDPRFEAILEKLRSARTSVAWSLTTRPNANVNGRVAAAMIFCARLWGDADREAIASARLNAADAFRSGADVGHFLDPEIDDRPYLGDYLALTEASLAEFQTTGRAPALETGVRLLNRAIDLFKTDTLGYVTDLPNHGDPLTLPDTSVPEIFDHVAESDSARFARLCLLYGQLVRGGSAEASAKRFRTFGEAILNQFGAAAAGMRAGGAGLYRAALIAEQEAVAVTVGPRSVELALEILRLEPRAIVTPSIGLARPDFSKRVPGVYIVRGTEFEGPLSPAQVAAQVWGGDLGRQ